MPYIQPNSTIYLYNNIELDNSYKDTLYFSGIEEQNQYFNVTKPWKYAFVQQMYQRTNKGTLRIEKNAEFLYDCNYLRFVNPRTVDGVTQAKWYYAFITNWEYINENVTEISYEIDIMQTYFFDVIIEPSFVVRQHEATDPLYGNVIEESINIGTNYTVADETRSYALSLDSVVAFSSKAARTSLSGNPRMTVINNVPTGIAVTPFIPNSGETLSQLLARVHDWATITLGGGTEVVESLIAVYLLPSDLCALIPDASYTPTSYGEDPTSYEGPLYVPQSLYIGSATTQFGNYTPHNKKLYCYPYSFITVSNHQGDIVDYKYELFRDPTLISFQIIGAVLPSPAYMCTPINYRGVSVDWDSSLLLQDFPTVPITVDGFQQFLTHNSGKMTASAISAIIGLGTTVATAGMTPIVSAMNPITAFGEAYGPGGGYQGLEPMNVVRSAFRTAFPRPGDIDYERNLPKYTPTTLGNMGMQRARQSIAGGGGQFLQSMISLLGTATDAQKLPNGVKGNLGGNGLLQSQNKYEFKAYKMQIVEQEARKIDTFFDMFGYAQNKVTDVNRNVRPVYTFTKTQGCSIIQNQVGNFNSGADSSVIAGLQGIYDAGITFWKPYSGFRIGDYSETARLANAV